MCAPADLRPPPTDKLLNIWQEKFDRSGGIPFRSSFEFPDFADFIGLVFATELIDGADPSLCVRLFGSELDTLFGTNLTDADLMETSPPDQAGPLLALHRKVWADGQPHIQPDWSAISPTGRVFKTRWAIVPVRRAASPEPYFLGAVDPEVPPATPSGSRF